MRGHQPPGPLSAAGGHFGRRTREAGAAPPPPPPPPAAATPLRDALLAPSAVRSASTPLASLSPAPPLPRPTDAAPSGGAGGGIGELIEAAFLETFWGERAAPRVLESFRRLRRGEEHVQLWPGLGLQRAESFVEGLSATPFPNPAGGAYPWLLEVERQAAVVQREFAEVTADAEALAAKVRVPRRRATRPPRPPAFPRRDVSFSSLSLSLSLSLLNSRCGFD